MHAHADKVKRYVYARIELIDAIEFLRPFDFVARDAPGKTAGATQLLRLCKKCLAAPQFFFDQLSSSDVGGESDHAKRFALIIEKHLTVGSQPMETAVGPLDAKFHR